MLPLLARGPKPAARTWCHNGVTILTGAPVWGVAPWLAGLHDLVAGVSDSNTELIVLADRLRESGHDAVAYQCESLATALEYALEWNVMIGEIITSQRRVDRMLGNTRGSGESTLRASLARPTASSRLSTPSDSNVNGWSCRRTRSAAGCLWCRHRCRVTRLIVLSQGGQS